MPQVSALLAGEKDNTVCMKLIERVSPGPRLELFAQRQAEGWTVWGDQVQPDLFAKTIVDSEAEGRP